MCNSAPVEDTHVGFGHKEKDKWRITHKHRTVPFSSSYKNHNVLINMYLCILLIVNSWILSSGLFAFVHNYTCEFLIVITIFFKLSLTFQFMLVIDPTVCSTAKDLIEIRRNVYVNCFNTWMVNIDMIQIWYLKKNILKFQIFKREVILILILLILIFIQFI